MTKIKSKLKKANTLLFISLGLFYISSLMPNEIMAQNQNFSTEWQLYKDVNGIHIYSKQIECNDEANGLFQEVVILKFVNTTKNDFTIKWDYELWYDNKCWTCDSKNSKENQKSISIDSQQVVVGDCENKNKVLRIFKRYTNHNDTSVLTKFELKNIITTIK